MKANITVLGGDGIGPEVTREGVRALQKVAQLFGHEFTLTERDFGGIAIDNHGDPLPKATLDSCLSADAILLGAINTVDVTRTAGNTVGALPFTLVLDREGAVASRQLGKIHEADLDGLLDRLLRRS